MKAIRVIIVVMLQVHSMVVQCSDPNDSLQTVAANQNDSFSSSASSFFQEIKPDLVISQHNSGDNLSGSSRCSPCQFAMTYSSEEIYQFYRSLVIKRSGDNICVDYSNAQLISSDDIKTGIKYTQGRNIYQLPADTVAVFVKELTTDTMQPCWLFLQANAGRPLTIDMLMVVRGEQNRSSVERFIVENS